MMGLITGWDHRYRRTGGPAATVHPAGTVLPDPDLLRPPVPRRHTVAVPTRPRPEQA